MTVKTGRAETGSPRFMGSIEFAPVIAFTTTDCHYTGRSWRLGGPECEGIRMLRRLVPVAALFSLLGACGPNAGTVDQASVTSDGSKQLILVARYTPTAQSNGIGAYADVPVGTIGTLEMTGPMHMHCDGTFQAQAGGGIVPFAGNRPGLDLGGGPGGIAFAAPAGEYTVVVSIPSKTVRVTKTFSAGTSGIDPITGVWD